VTAALIHQWKHVFRYAAGDEVRLFDGNLHEVRARIDVLTKEKAELTVLETLPHGWVLPREVWLYASIVKKDTFEWLAEKCTELGVSKIIPIITDRTIKKDVHIERLTAIVIEASEQSERRSIPTVNEPVSLEDALAETESMKRFVCKKDGNTTIDQSQEPVALFIGPEGGWSDAECAIFESKKIPSVSLGVQNLKAETAAIVAVASASSSANI